MYRSWLLIFNLFKEDKWGDFWFFFSLFFWFIMILAVFIYDAFWSCSLLHSLRVSNNEFYILPCALDIGLLAFLRICLYHDVFRWMLLVLIAHCRFFVFMIQVQFLNYLEFLLHASMIFSHVNLKVTHCFEWFWGAIFMMTIVDNVMLDWTFRFLPLIHDNKLINYKLIKCRALYIVDLTANNGFSVICITVKILRNFIGVLMTDSLKDLTT